jgi:hypothetical protein
MTFFQRNARFIVPLPWLILMAMKLWQAVHVGGLAAYAGALGFAGLAVLGYLSQRVPYRKRRQESAPT